MDFDTLNRRVFSLVCSRLSGKVKTASGATAVQLTRRVDGRDKIIKRLGSAHTDQELAVLLEIARQQLDPGQGEFDLGLAQKHHPIRCKPLHGRTVLSLRAIPHVCCGTACNRRTGPAGSRV